MQPAENYNASRRPLDVEDYIDIVRRHKSWIFGPALLSLVIAVVGVYMYPDTYVSRAVVKITPQQVPESMVESSINQAMWDRILSMENTILSRSVLTNIINTLGLYQRERARGTLEDVIDEMKQKIVISTLSNNQSGGNSKTVPAFFVQFSYENRFLAQRVVQDLVGRFIDENITNRSNATFQTAQFMKDEFDQAKKALEESENKLAAFRMANNGRLPDQADANMRQLIALETRASMLESAINRTNQDKLQMESNLRIMRDNLNAMLREAPESAGTAQRNEKLFETEREIQGLENALTQFRQRYSDNYPDVQTLQTRLNNAKKKRDDIVKEEATKKEEAAKEAAKNPDTPKPRYVSPQVVREARELENRMRSLQSLLEGKDMEIQEFVRELKKSHEAAKAYQARVETVPMGEKQYGELTRDRDIAKSKYMDLDVKLGKARIAQEMETRKQGEVLDLLDPANLPSSPTEPKRPMIISIGAGLGLLLGIVIAGAREMKDTSLKNLKDVRAYTQMAILGSIPLLENDFVVRRRKRLAWLGWTTACLAAIVLMAGSIVYYFTTKP